MSVIPNSTTINVSTATDNEIVAARTGHSIVVKGWVLQAASAVNVTWKSASTAKAGPMAAGANGGSVAPTADGWFGTASGEALNLTLSGAVQVGGVVVWEYVKVP